MAFAQQAQSTRQAAPSVAFVTPKNGEAVTSSFVSKFEVQGMGVNPAGDMTPNTGHFHVFIDAPCIAKGQPVPFDSQHLHYGKGQTEATIEGLSKGDHQLALQSADGAHLSYGENMCQVMNIKIM